MGEFNVNTDKNTESGVNVLNEDDDKTRDQDEE